MGRTSNSNAVINFNLWVQKECDHHSAITMEQEGGRKKAFAFAPDYRVPSILHVQQMSAGWMCAVFSFIRILLASPSFPSPATSACHHGCFLLSGGRGKMPYMCTMIWSMFDLNHSHLCSCPSKLGLWILSYNFGSMGKKKTCFFNLLYKKDVSARKWKLGKFQ